MVTVASAYTPLGAVLQQMEKKTNQTVDTLQAFPSKYGREQGRGQ